MAIRRTRPQQRDSVPVRLPDGRDIQLLRVVDPRARRLRLLVSERGPRLTVPPGASATDAQRFLDQHLDWLADHLAEDPHAPTPQPLEPGRTGSIRLRGQVLAVTWRESAWLQVKEDAGQLTIGMPPGGRPDALRRALREFYLANARQDVGQWLPRYLAGLPRAPREWKIRPLTSLWGSLSASGTMSLDLALALAPPAAFEYVLVHELCHLIQPNHSAAFWHEVERRFPDWRTQRRWLREQGLEVKRELRRLIG